MKALLGVGFKLFFELGSYLSDGWNDTLISGRRNRTLKIK